ncbi:MAG TPA: AlpA family transcriptional regulator [Novimethylophilus sp.]|jgi:prophage regulatory protein|uniref:helix-turn-helix transcriptional regulator n=1 Tax=Novimethylophilus sp. TaxID=2137426 RepID=UPI002F42F3CF
MKILRKHQVLEMTGLARSTLYHYIKLGKFPAQVKLGSKIVGWLESEVNDWISARVQCRNNHANS